MSRVDENGIKEVFNEHFDSAIADDVVRECVQLCTSFAKSPDDLVFKWQSICINTRSSQVGSSLEPLDMAGITLLKRELQKEALLAAQSKKAGAVNAKRSQVRSQPRQSLPQALRQPVVSVKTENLPIKILDNLKDRQYRYMHERLAERATVLDDKIDEFAELVREFYNLEDIGDPASTSDEELVVVGRICCDEDAKLNEASLVIETSRLMGAGARIPLKMNPNVAINGDATVYPLFPGAIVALKGRNETGEWFQVSQILTIPRLPPNEDAQKQERPLTMTVAAGPYSSDSDLSYSPFLSLLDQIRKSPPSWLLLLGPFVDANHSKISNGDVDMNATDLFRSRILGPLRTLLEGSPGTTVLILSSVTDLLSQHAVFPQPPLPLSQALQSDRIIFLPNPCTFTIDHVKFAVSSVDVFFHLQSQILRKRVTPQGPAAAADAMASLAGCVLEQRSFYPLFPAYPTDVNLDVSHSEMLRFDSTAPDVLILPSRLKQFHKIVNGTMVINPSLASKGVHGTMIIQDPRTSAKMGIGATPSVAERTTVQLPSTQSAGLLLD